jgi:hypothetical protein
MAAKPEIAWNQSKMLKNSETWEFNESIDLKTINWSIVICLVIDYTGFGGSFYININKKPWWMAIS